MTILVTVEGPNVGREFYLADGQTTIGRQGDCTIALESPAVSRVHAAVVLEQGELFVEDLGSSNGTYLNGVLVEGRVEFREEDRLQVGPYQFTLRRERPEDTDPIVRSSVNALTSNQSLYSQNPTQKLQLFVEIVQGLGRTLEVQPVLDKLLEQLLRLFPQADRGMVLLCDREQLTVRAQRVRPSAAPATTSSGPLPDMPVAAPTDYPFSRTLVRRALGEGVGLLSTDVRSDTNVPQTATMVGLDLRSFLCVPLLGFDQKGLGVVQLDCLRTGKAFRHEDLELLTALALQVAGLIENAALHEARLREEGWRRELALAREIQQSYLPTNFAPLRAGGYELFARLQPAREVSGDLYDFFPQPDGRLALFLGDVTGKGMPAALFMIAVRTLVRHLAGAVHSASEMVLRLNNALVADNATSLFVTLAHALFDPRSGVLSVVSCGHPAPLIRRADGVVEEVAVSPTMMLGYEAFDNPPAETRIALLPGDTLVFYTDGITEASTPNDRRNQFGADRLQQLLAELDPIQPLSDHAEQVCRAVARFSSAVDLQDDQTLLMLRRT